jgi:hypothetical protein
LVHHRPEKRHRGGCSAAPPAMGRGQVTSMAAAIAATSSSVASPPRAIVMVDVEVLTPVAYSGTLPCLRFGSSSRFERSRSSPAISFTRVSAGSMTSST